MRSAEPARGHCVAGTVGDAWLAQLQRMKFPIVYFSVYVYLDEQYIRAAKGPRIVECEGGGQVRTASGNRGQEAEGGTHQ